MGASGEPEEPVKGATLRREDCELDPNDFWHRFFFGSAWVVFPAVLGTIILSRRDLHTGTCLLSNNPNYGDYECHFPDSHIVSGYSGRPSTTFTKELPGISKTTADCRKFSNTTVDCGWGSDVSQTTTAKEVKSLDDWAKGAGGSLIALSVLNLLVSGCVYVRCQKRVKEAIHFEAYATNSTIQVGWMWNNIGATSLLYVMLGVLLCFGTFIAIYTLVAGITIWVAISLVVTLIQPIFMTFLWSTLTWYQFDEEHFSKGTTQYKWSDVEKCVEGVDSDGNPNGFTVKWKGILSEEFLYFNGPAKEYFFRTLKLITGVEAERRSVEMSKLL